MNKYTLLYSCTIIDRIVMVVSEAMSDKFMIFLSTHSTERTTEQLERMGKNHNKKSIIENKSV